jgi:Uma2 family endonuclease
MEVYEISFETLGGLTDEQFYSFCQSNKQLKFERSSEGEIFIMGLTGSETGERNHIVNGLLFVWNRQYRVGKCFDSSTGFTLPSTAVRSPDAAFVSSERWNKLTNKEQKTFAPICPDFVIELMSQSDYLQPAQAKMREWMAGGCRLAWLINVDTAQAFIYRTDGTVTTLQGMDTVLSGEDVLPHFEFVLRDLLENNEQENNPKN